MTGIYVIAISNSNDTIKRVAALIETVLRPAKDVVGS